MPYINKEARDYLNKTMAPMTCGELNYAVTLLIKSYTDRKGLSYQTINDVSGALTEALAEYRRRVVVSYENEKSISNGDVY